MAKYSDIINGNLKLTEAINTSAGAGDAGKVPKLNASGLIDSTMLPPSSVTHYFVSTSTQLDNALIALRALGGGKVTLLNDITYNPGANRDITNITIEGSVTASTQVKLTFGNANYLYGTTYRLNNFGVDPNVAGSPFRTVALVANFIIITSIQHRGTGAEWTLDMGGNTVYLTCNNMYGSGIARINNTSATTGYAYDGSLLTVSGGTWYIDSSSSVTGAGSVILDDEAINVLATPLTGYTSTNTQAYMNEIIGAKQKNQNFIVLGNTVSGHVKGKDCDYVETDLATTTFSNCTLVIKNGDYSAFTLQLGGNGVRLIYDNTAILGTITATCNIIFSDYLVCDTLNANYAGETNIYSQGIQLNNLNSSNSVLIYNAAIGSLGNINITTNLLLVNVFLKAVSPLIGSIGNLFIINCSEVGVNCTCNNMSINNSSATIGSSTINNNLRIYNSNIATDIPNIGNDLLITNSIVEGVINNIIGNVDINNSFLKDVIGNIGGYLEFIDSTLSDSIGTIGNNCKIVNSNIGSGSSTIGNINGALTVYDSNIGANIGDITVNVDATSIISNSSILNINDFVFAGGATYHNVEIINGSKISNINNITSDINCINSNIASINLINAGNFKETYLGTLINVLSSASFTNCEVGQITNYNGGIIKNSTIDIISNITDSCNIIDSFIDQIETIIIAVNLFNIYNSYIREITNDVQANTNIYNSTIAIFNGISNPLYLDSSKILRYDSQAAILNLTSKNSYIYINDPLTTLNILLTDNSSLNIETDPSIILLTLGIQTDYSNININSQCPIKIIDDAANIDNFLSISYKYNIEFDLSANQSNILERIGDRTLITDTNNEYCLKNENDYGEMYQYDNSNATTINTVDIWEEVNNFTAGELGSTSEGITFNAQSLVIKRNGLYHVNYSASIEAASTNKDFEFAISVNDNIENKSIIKRYIATNDTGDISGTCLINLNKDDYIKFEVRNLTDATNITIVDCNVNLIKVC